MIYIAILILLFCLVIGVPVPMSFMASTAWLLFFGGANGSGYQTSMVLPYGFSSMNSIALISIALFIMAGGIMERGRIGEKLINLVDLLVGRIKGGLGVVGTISCAVFGSITGSACATLSCIGSIMFPRLEEAGYPRELRLLSCQTPRCSGCSSLEFNPHHLRMDRRTVHTGLFLSTVIPGLIMTA